MAKHAPPPERCPTFGCLLWQGQLDRDGYAIDSKRGPRAHLVSFVRSRGPVPAGRVVDHLCRRRHCVEPRHLEAVTRAENEFRKRAQHRFRRAVCPLGHSMQRPAVTPEGGVLCRACLDSLLGRGQRASGLPDRSAGV